MIHLSQPKINTYGGISKNHLIPLHHCPICKSTKLKKIFKSKTINSNSDLRVDVLECAYCQHWFVNPIIKQEHLSSLYKNKSEYVIPKGWDGKKSDFSIPELFVINREKENTNERKKYLEIGVGSGFLLKYFKKNGYDCYGIDPGHWADGISGIVKDISDLNECDFNIVVLIDVLEHLEDPLSYIRNLSNILDGGSIYASFPNNQSLRAILFKRRWRMIRPFGHLHFFSKKSLQILFESIGFRINKILKTDLIKIQLKYLLEPPLFLIGGVFFLTQPFWGDQWMVHLQRTKT